MKVPAEIHNPNIDIYSYHIPNSDESIDNSLLPVCTALLLLRGTSIYMLPRSNQTLKKL